MIFKQFYLPCLAHASYMIGDEETGTAAVVDPQRDTDQYIVFAAEHAPQDQARIPDASPRRFCRRASGTARSRGRNDLSRRRGQSGVRVYSAARWRHSRIRARAPEGAGNAGPHSGVDLHRRLRPERQRNAAARRAHRRHSVHRRRGAARSARGAGLVGHRTWRHAFRFAAHQAAGAAGSKPGVSGARRGLALRESAQQGNGFHPGRTAPLELRAAAHEQGSIHSGGDGRSAGSSGLFQL